MEIIKHGSTYQELECHICKAKLGYTHKDIQHSVMKDTYNGTVHETISEFLYCPECGGRIVLSLKIDGIDHEICGN